MAKQKLLPTTFHECARGYELLLGPDGGMGSEAISAEGALRTMKYSDDGDCWSVTAIYRQQTIGRARYRKYGPYGQLTRLETLSADGAMVNLLEPAFAQIQTEQDRTDAATRLSSMPPVRCRCGRVYAYDLTHATFRQIGTDEEHATGATMTQCECGQRLALDVLHQYYEQEVHALETSLQQVKNNLRSIEEIEQRVAQNDTAHHEERD